MVVSPLLRTLSLRWHHRLHATRMTRESSALRRSLPIHLRAHNHHGTNSSLTDGTTCYHPQRCKDLNQTLRLYTHLTRRWSSNSVSWSLKAQGPLLGRSCQSRRSNAQHVPWMTRHKKKRHLPGTFISIALWPAGRGSAQGTLSGMLS
jgi:hypothetical protein